MILNNTTQANPIILLDGGMGTQLQAAGLKPGEHPEIFGIQHPEILESIHRRYIEAGSEIIYSNTFGANAHKLTGTGVSVEEAFARNIEIARQAAAGHPNVRVAADIGPIGELLEPMGTLTFEEAYELHREMVCAGAAAGADLIVIETLTDLYEAKAALLAAKENTNLPVWITMSFEKNGRTFLGTKVSSMASTLGHLGADALGINCSLGPDEIYPLIREMMEWTDRPILVKPNAGLPDPKTGEYDMDAEAFAESMRQYAAPGIAAVGGCCGTNPDFIRRLADGIHAEDMTYAHAHAETEADDSGTAHRGFRSGICSASSMAEYGKINVIGERINPTGKKKLQQALRDEDMDYVKQLAVEQQEAGADILDINVGAQGVDEAKLIVKVVKAVQSVCDLPLQIDSADPNVLEAGVRVCNGRPLINSVNGERERMDSVFPIAKRYGAALLGLTMDEEGIPDSAEKRMEIAESIIGESKKYGIPQEDIILDCLTLTISAQQDQAKETLRAVRYAHDVMGQHCALGVSNIAFGLPARIHASEAFLIQSLGCGLDFPIINPNLKENMDAVTSVRALTGEDPGCAAYIRRFAPEEAEKKRKKKAAAARAAGAAAGTNPLSPANGAGIRDAGSAGAAAGSGAYYDGVPGTGASGGVYGGANMDGISGMGSTSGYSAGDSDAPETNGDALPSDFAKAPLPAAILRGLEKEALDVTDALLEQMLGMEIINTYIIPSLDLVGKLYEEEEIFLPQMLNSAAAACAGLDRIKAKIAESGEKTVSRGKIILATVEGDIHDIGKNIVKVVLENYGYEVIDLGRDVPVQTVVDETIRNDVYLVGLSALMTTTVVAMKETIAALRASGHACKIVVGGAVLTPEYAAEIGADYYAKDAAATAEIAKKVLG